MLHREEAGSSAKWSAVNAVIFAAKSEKRLDRIRRPTRDSLSRSRRRHGRSTFHANRCLTTLLCFRFTPSVTPAQSSKMADNSILPHPDPGYNAAFIATRRQHESISEVHRAQHRVRLRETAWSVFNRLPINMPQVADPYSLSNHIARSAIRLSVSKLQRR